MPMIPFAPGRLSTMTCWPQDSVSFWATWRAMMSGPEAGACGTMIRMGRVGYVCAVAAAAATSDAAHRMAEMMMGFMGPPSFVSVQSSYRHLRGCAHALFADERQHFALERVEHRRGR